MIKKKFSLFDNINQNLESIENIDNSIKIGLGPTGKNGIYAPLKTDLQFLTSGFSFIKNLELKSTSGTVLLKLFEQAASKTSVIAGDGSTTTILFCCQLLNTSLRFLVNGYNGILLSNGLKKIASFFMEKVIEFSKGLDSEEELKGVLKTSIGKKLNSNLFELLEKSISTINRDGLFLVEENITTLNQLETIQGLELDKGFASSYFVNDLKNFEVFFENPYLLITSDPITSFNQIREIIEYVKSTTRPLVIIAEEINKEIISTLVLNNLQKKIKVAVIRYNAIKFIKSGILEDLAILTHSNYFCTPLKNNIRNFSITDLGQAEKVTIKKEKSIFSFSKFSKLVASRRVNELNRELLTSETDYEKMLIKTRIARLSGNITKLKIGISNKYQIQEERQKVETALSTIRSSLEEGILPGGGSFYLYLKEELKQWSYLNLIGDEIFSSQIAIEALKRPFEELAQNTNNERFAILEKIEMAGYPYTYNFIDKKFGNAFKIGLIDSSKSIRAILWNSFTIIATLLTSD